MSELLLQIIESIKEGESKLPQEINSRLKAEGRAELNLEKGKRK